MMKWKCMICGHTFEGDIPPDSCPGIPKHQSRFKEIKEIAVANKRGETRAFPAFHSSKDQTKTVTEEPKYFKIQVEDVSKEPRYLEIDIVDGEAGNK